MQTTFDSESRRLTLTFAAGEEIKGFIAGAKKQEGFLATVPERLRRREALTAILAAPGLELELGVAALHVFGESGEGFATAFDFAAWGAAKEVELRRKLQALAEGPTEAEARGETLGSSPIFRIQKMTPPEKARLAMRGNRTERQLLLRETSPQIMMGLLNNPHVETEEVLQIVKSPYAPGSILKRVAHEHRWSGSPDVRLALVRNPQTPTPLAVSLLPGLPTTALQVLARGGEVREDLKKAALKIYLKRMGK